MPTREVIKWSLQTEEADRIYLTCQEPLGKQAAKTNINSEFAISIHQEPVSYLLRLTKRIHASSVGQQELWYDNQYTEAISHPFLGKTVLSGTSLSWPM